MSKVSIQGDVSGTGDFTIKAPNSNVDRTLNLPDEAGTVLTNVSDIETQVKTATNATGSAPVYACRAWVNFDGTGTVFIRGSGNVSSITDNGTGNYTVNFTTAMPDAAYCAVFSKRNAVTNDNPGYLMNVVSANQFNIQTFENNTHTDSAEVYASVFR
jgi:hypothetical protein